MTGSVESVPLWLFAIVSVVTLVSLVALFALARKKRRTDEAPAESTVSAQIFGINWRWTQRAAGEVCDIASFCPRCDRRVIPSEETRHGFLRLIAFRCHCSDWRSRSFQCSHEDLLERIVRAIKEETQKPHGAAVPRA